MKKINEKRNAERGLQNYQEIYKKVISNNLNKDGMMNIVDELLRKQKDDGSWSVIDDYQVDSDIRVLYVYYPTYYVTATLMNIDLKMSFENESKEKKALIKGLIFAIGRRLRGHGYTATESLLNTINIYKGAGLYEWMKNNTSIAEEFCNVIHMHIISFKNALSSNKTYSDWDRNFEKEFRQEVKEYENAFYEYVWYAAYGSNLCESRFMKYINSCSDSSKPLESLSIIIPHNIYFASKSSTWGNKGVAFLDNTKEGMAYCRLYKIKRSQFEELHIKEGMKYNEIVELGFLEGFPILSFTSSKIREDMLYPSIEYLNVIKQGLKETYPDKPESVLFAYLLSKILNENDLRVLEILRNETHGVSVEYLLKIGIEYEILASNIRKLSDLNLIKQDSRSVNQGYSLIDNGSVIYTKSEARDAIDAVLLAKSI